jgi:hypothetical protein
MTFVTLRLQVLTELSDKYKDGNLGLLGSHATDGRLKILAVGYPSLKWQESQGRICHFSLDPSPFPFYNQNA